MTIVALTFASFLIAGAARQGADTLTPGAVVLLANKKDAQATATTRTALTSPDPLVRRAAARVTAVAHPEAFDELRHALDDERDPVVVAEFVKAIMALAGAKALPIVQGIALQAGGEPVLAIAEWFARMDPDGFVSHLPAWAEASRSNRGLANIVRLAIECHPDARNAILTVWRRVASEAAITFAELTAADSQTEAVITTPPPLAAQLLPSTLTGAGCPSKNAFMIAEVLFRPDGRPRSIDAQRRGLSDGCHAALIATAMMSSADPTDRARRPHQMMIPISKEFLSCARASTDPPLLTTWPPTDDVREPRLVKERKPDYTQNAMEAKLEGVVEFDVVVSKDGCVAGARETRSLKLSSGLDVQGLIAILEWEFEPARLDDKAVSTVVAVQLTFTLR